SSVIRRPARRVSRSRTSSRKFGERRTSKRSCTALASLLTFWPPGPEARMKRSSSSSSSMLIVSVTRIISPPAWVAGLPPIGGQISLRQHLALLDRRLIERIDAHEPGGDDRLQHEVHEQGAEARFVEALEMDRAHRAAVVGERLGGGARLGGGELADR